MKRFGMFNVFAQVPSKWRRKITKWLAQVIQTSLMCVPGLKRRCLQCFDAVGWAAGRASGL